MPYSSNELSQELAGMSDRFSELGERLIQSARRLHAPGILPREDLWNTYTSCRDDFYALREHSRDLAASLHVNVPPAETLESLQAINDLLDHAAEAEIRRSKAEELRDRALLVLDRVVSLSHASSPDFTPLNDLRNHARGLRQEVAAGSWTQPHAETEPLAEGEHPLSHLLGLIEDRDELHDDHWAYYHESVTHHFGRELAAAAARGKLAVDASEAYGQRSQDRMALGSV